MTTTYVATGNMIVHVLSKSSRDLDKAVLFALPIGDYKITSIPVPNRVAINSLLLASEGCNILNLPLDLN